MPVTSSPPRPATAGAPAWLSDKSASPFKKLKQLLAQHRLERRSRTSLGFLDNHRAAAHECLMAALDAYEKHRNEAVQKLQGTCENSSLCHR